MEKKLSKHELQTYLAELRFKLDLTDERTLALLNERMLYIIEIAKVKKELGLPVLDLEREQNKIKRLSELTELFPASMIQKIFVQLFGYSRLVQDAILNEKPESK